MSRREDSFLIHEELDVINKEANEEAAQDYLRIRAGAEVLLDNRKLK
ncbi:hypothetical protein IT084_07940 [Desulfallas sp. Bu1-1]|nr:hypothetical protein [Desulfallas sp. Bu1-1]MBF7082903.1 hypothetical protein [Desulfallas sp. Bu1-1]